MLKRIVTSILLCLIMLLAAGCASVPEPKGPKDALLVGKILLRVRGYEDSAVAINGKRKSRIEMVFRNVETRDTCKIWSKEFGLFYKTQLEPGTYIIDRISYKKTDSVGSWTQLSWDRPVPLLRIIIKEGTVTNLGSILWLADKREGRYGVIQDQDPKELQKELAEKFPDSEWLNRPWKNVYFP